jgi:anaerobic nitric oxide reductase transcription regulator
LFGHVTGAFTGAVRDRTGKFEVADGGTLFLDEIGELPLTIQPTLLRAIQYGEVQRVGSDRLIRVNVRIVAATNRNLSAEVAAGNFRADLYHRLTVYPIHVPPLRERCADIPVLSAHFLDVRRQRLGLGPVRLADDARERLAAAEWPGNVRELENVVSRSVLRAARRGAGRRAAVLVLVEDLDIAPAAGKHAFPEYLEDVRTDENAGWLSERIDAYRRRIIVAAVKRHGGNWAAAARELGLHRSNLHHLAARLGIRERRWTTE